jgi:hypothetical protein
MQEVAKMNGQHHATTTPPPNPTIASRVIAIPSRILAHREQAKKIVESLASRKQDAESVAMKEFCVIAKDDIEFIGKIVKKTFGRAE